MTAWTVRDSTGQLIADFAAGSRLDVGRKLVPTHYDAFRLQVSSSYRQLFDRALSRILAQKGWEIVCTARSKRSALPLPRCSGRPTWPHPRAKACT
jgi:hypothetical protein